MSRTLPEIEDELDRLQISYIEEEDDVQQMDIERRFTQCLEEATELDGILRTARGVTITNWVRDT